MNQCQRLQNYLAEHDAIDPMIAWTVLGIYRLGARIFDLKASGIKIISDTVKVNNRFGEECRVASYSINAEQRLADALIERESAQVHGDDERVKDLFAEIAVLRVRIERMKARAA